VSLDTAVARGRRLPDLGWAYSQCGRLTMLAALVGVSLWYLPAAQAPLGWVLLAPACVCAAAFVALGFPRVALDLTSRGILAWGGVAFFVIAAAADVAATLWHSPTLDEEGNVLVRSLLSRWPLLWVLVGAGVFQLAFFSLTVSLWHNLLARWSWYLGELATRDRLPLWLAMSGVRRGGMSRLFGMGRYADLALAASAFYLPWAYLGRLYLAMEWMGWVPISRQVMPGVLLGAAFLTHWCVVRRALRKMEKV